MYLNAALPEHLTGHGLQKDKEFHVKFVECEKYISVPSTYTLSLPVRFDHHNVCLFPDGLQFHPYLPLNFTTQISTWGETQLRPPSATFAISSPFLYHSVHIFSSAYRPRKISITGLRVHIFRKHLWGILEKTALWGICDNLAGTSKRVRDKLPDESFLLRGLHHRLFLCGAAARRGPWVPRFLSF